MNQPTGKLKFAYNTITQMEAKIKKLESFHTTKHNRDVELTDLLAELGETYSHILTPDELRRIQDLTREE